MDGCAGGGNPSFEAWREGFYGFEGNDESIAFIHSLLVRFVGNGKRGSSIGFAFVVMGVAGSDHIGEFFSGMDQDLKERPRKTEQIPFLSCFGMIPEFGCLTGNSDDIGEDFFAANVGASFNQIRGREFHGVEFGICGGWRGNEGEQGDPCMGRRLVGHGWGR